MLGCITDKGELVRLFWPNIDYPQHVEKMAVGLFYTAQTDSTMWLGEEIYQQEQHYIEDTNILKTVYLNREKNIRVIQTDFCLPEKDVLIRSYDVENTGQYALDLGFVSYSSCISTNPDLRCSLFDFKNDALVHYRHGYYISISSEYPVKQFQLGNNAFGGASHTVLNGYDSIGMMPEGALSWDMGRFWPGEKKSIALKICAAGTLNDVKALTAGVGRIDTLQECLRVEAYWKDFINSAKRVNTGRWDIDRLYRRSLLVFKLMSDEKTGGLLAAPEIDEQFTKCGRYAYCWGRDAAFITSALDQCGLTAAVDRFYDWAVRTQDDDGSWLQRYHMDGNIAPSWGLQIDETGTLVWGMLEHYKITGSTGFLEKMWNSVEKAVDFMIDFIDNETGLPGPSFDLWEERMGEHLYSSAAVYGGIKAGVDIARILRKSDILIYKWERACEAIKEAIDRNFWKEEKARFIRSVRVKLNPWGGEHSPHTTIIKVNSKDYYRDVTLEDGTMDVSLLGAAVPFRVYGLDSYKMEGTVKAVEQVLSCPWVGGIKRYENDNYIGGNPWIIASLWVALHYSRRGDYGKAREYLDWTVKGQTELGLLPEQVGRDDGKPAWVIPLTWSHAMFVLVLMDLVEHGAF